MLPLKSSAPLGFSPLFEAPHLHFPHSHHRKQGWLPTRPSRYTHTFSLMPSADEPYFPGGVSPPWVGPVLVLAPGTVTSALRRMLWEGSHLVGSHLSLPGISLITQIIDQSACPRLRQG